MKKLYPLALLLLLIPVLTMAQTRYLDEVFPTVTKDVELWCKCRLSISFVRVVKENLNMDVYMPEGDTETDRPLILYFPYRKLPAF